MRRRRHGAAGRKEEELYQPQLRASPSAKRNNKLTVESTEFVS